MKKVKTANDQIKNEKELRIAMAQLNFDEAEARAYIAITNQEKMALVLKWEKSRS